MFDILRKHLMLTLLVGIPLSALTDLRPWTSAEGLPAPPARTPVESPATPVESKQPTARRFEDEEWFQQAQQKLRLLGAIYVRLEKWNASQPVYRLRCDFASRNEGSPAETFEALSESAREATERVLRDAQAWQGSARRKPPNHDRRSLQRPRIEISSPSAAASWR